MLKRAFKYFGMAYLICGLLTAIVAGTQEYRLEKSEGASQGMIISNVVFGSIVSLISWPLIIYIQVGLRTGAIPYSPGGGEKTN